MKLTFKFFLLAISLICFLTIPLNAQNEDYELKKGDNEFTIWGGYSPTSNSAIGKVEEARLGMVGFRYSRVLVGRSAALKYTIDGVPAAFLSFPTPRVTIVSPGVFRIDNVRETFYGAGAAPIGLQLNFRNKKKVQPFVNGSGGFLVFNKKIPDRDFGARFNFTFDFGGGVQVMLRDRKALTFGYKYHHISNGYHAPVNPGFDSNLFYFGFSFFK